MIGGVRLLLPSASYPPPFVPPSPTAKFSRCDLAAQKPVAVSSASASGGGELTARERRQLKNEKRESRAGGVGWREEVEERLLHRSKNKRKPASWTEELNLDHLARLGPQWWVVRVARVNGHETADRLARRLPRSYPSVEFKVYFPAVRLKRKSKIRSESVKLKPLFPGCVFLNCILNKEIHDFVREVDGVGGFVGSKVGNTKRQINKPKPVPQGEMEAIFQKAKEEQENADKESKDEQDLTIDNDSGGNTESAANAKLSKSKKVEENFDNSPVGLEGHKSLSPGATIRILSGPLSEFTGCIKELNHQTGKVSVSLKLFGKATTVDLEVDQIVLEAS